MKRAHLGIILLCSTLILTGCGKLNFSSTASSLCVNSAKAAVKAYNGATTPTGRSIAEKAVDTAVLAGESLAGLISNNKAGVAKNIHDTLTTLRKRKSLSTAAGAGVNELATQKKNVDAALTKLGALCSQAVK